MFCIFVCNKNYHNFIHVDLVNDSIEQKFVSLEFSGTVNKIWE